MYSFDKIVQFPFRFSVKNHKFKSLRLFSSQFIYYIYTALQIKIHTNYKTSGREIKYLL